jgi:hypothetical protein
MVMRSTVVADLIHPLRLPLPLKFLAETSFRSNFYPIISSFLEFAELPRPPQDPGLSLASGLAAF